MFMAVVACATGPGWSWPAGAVPAIAGGAAALAGVVLIVLASIELREAFTPMPRPRDRAAFIDSGPYRFVRHPIYTGVLVAAVGGAIATASVPGMALAAALFAFLQVKSRREEAWLERVYPAYSAYRAQTPRFIPLPGGPRG
jgi:protein-S-isoprenylcysteine O-methyltransferase Ste14